MAKTQDIKRRIRSISNTMQLTKAMKMVAAAKLRRAQDRILGARPYAQRLLQVLQSLASRADSETHPLLQTREGKRIELVVVTGDKGLCGAFNSGILRTAQAFGAGIPGAEVSITAIGRKGREFFSSRNTISRSWEDVFRSVDHAKAKEISEELMERFVNDEVDQIHLVYNEFKSAIQAKPTVQLLLPIERADFGTDGPAEEYIYEPSEHEIFSSLVPHYVENQVFRSMLESVAAEHAARMTAMDSATRNAGELIESLTLTMNRVRQTSITTEIIEVVSGAEALG